MAERLTEHNKTGWALKLNDPQNEFEAKQQLMSKFKLACEKLGKLEDIMEKYGIEDLEQYLQRVRKIDKELRDTIQQLHTIIDTIGYDRDTWQKACELACKYMCKFVIPCPDIHRKECKSFCDLNKADCYQDYFYQQVKKEG